MPAPPHQNVSLVIFDLDGTLVDTSQDLTDALNRAMTSAGLPPLTREQVIRLVGDGSRKLVDRAVAAVGGPSDLSPEVAKRFLADYAQHVLVATKPYPGIEDTLTRLRSRQGLHLALYSNKPTKHVHDLLAGLGWDAWFEVVLGGDWGGPKKPAPDGITHIIDSLDLSGVPGVMVGDGSTDQRAGHAAGLSTVAVTWGYRTKRDLEPYEPDVFCEDPAHLLDAIMGLLDHISR